MGTTQLTSQLIYQKIASSDVARKVASGTIACWINQGKADTPILMQRWVVEKTRVGVHANLVVAQVYKSLDSSKLDHLRWRRSETTLR